jgi:hypothetical protein
VVLGVYFPEISFVGFSNCVAMAKVLVSRIGVQFPHKLLDFVWCSCFFPAFMNYYVIKKKRIDNSNLKFGNAYAP